MTAWHGLLVSVRDPAEVDPALAGGAAIIDIKDPARGSLGAASAETIAAIARGVAGRAPWTIAAGELADELRDPGRTRRLVEQVRDLVGVPPDAAKLGLAGLGQGNWREAFAAVMSSIPADVGRVAVAYADWQRVGAPDPRDVVSAGAASGCEALLIDTADKSAPGLLAACSADVVAGWVSEARTAGMRVALAGRLSLAEIPAVMGFGPDVVALRSAVCFNGRLGSVDATLVRAAARAMCTLSEAAPQ